MWDNLATPLPFEPSGVVGRCLPQYAILRSAPKHTRVYPYAAVTQSSYPSIVSCGCLCGCFIASTTTKWGLPTSQLAKAKFSSLMWYWGGETVRQQQLFFVMCARKFPMGFHKPSKVWLHYGKYLCEESQLVDFELSNFPSNFHF